MKSTSLQNAQLLHLNGIHWGSPNSWVILTWLTFVPSLKNTKGETMLQSLLSTEGPETSNKHPETMVTYTWLRFAGFKPWLL